MESMEPIPEWKGRRVKYGIYIVWWILNTTYAMLSPFFPIEAKNKNVDDIVIGLFFASFQVAILMFTTSSHSICARFGGYKVLLIGLIGECVVTGLFPVLDMLHGASFAVTCIFFRILQGVSYCLNQSGATELLLVHLPSADTDLAFERLEFLGSMGLTFGPLIGGLLYTYAGYKPTFWICSGAIFACFFCFVILLKDTQMRLDRKQIQLRGAVGWSGALIIALIMLIMGSLSFLDPILALHLSNKYQLNSIAIGGCFLVCSLVYGLGARITALPRFREFSALVLVGFGLLVVSCGLLLVGNYEHILSFIPTDFPYVALGLGLLGSGTAIAASPSNQLFAATLPMSADRDAIIYRMNLISFSLGSSLGHILGSLLYSVTDFSYACYIGALLNVSWILICLFAAKQGLFNLPDAYEAVDIDYINTQQSPSFVSLN